MSGRFVAAPSSGDRDRRRVRGEDALRLRQAVEAAEQRLLGVDVLDDRFDDVVGGAELVERVVRPDSRPSAASRSAADSRPFSTNFARLLPTPRRARSSIGCATSTSRTSKPACANAWAMPLPIVPAPTTPTVLRHRIVRSSFTHDYDRSAFESSLAAVERPSVERQSHRSTASATPLPPPRHSVAMPRFASRRFIA